jgi:hypothetical protein
MCQVSFGLTWHSKFLLIPIMEDKWKSTVELQEWLLSTASQDKWWICIDGIADECTLTLKEIEETLVSGGYPNAQVLHDSEASNLNPDWTTVFYVQISPDEYEHRQLSRLEDEQRILEDERRIEVEESLHKSYENIVNHVRANGFDSLHIDDLKIVMKNHHACLKLVLDDSHVSIREELWNLFQLSANSTFIANIYNAGELAQQTQKIQDLALQQQYPLTGNVAVSASTAPNRLGKLNQENKNIKHIAEGLFDSLISV